MSGIKIIPFIMDKDYTVNIDTELDWSHAVSLMKKGENND